MALVADAIERTNIRDIIFCMRWCYRMSTLKADQFANITGRASFCVLPSISFRARNIGTDNFSHQFGLA